MHPMAWVDWICGSSLVYFVVQVTVRSFVLMQAPLLDRSGCRHLLSQLSEPSYTLPEPRLTPLLFSNFVS